MYVELVLLIEAARVSAVSDALLDAGALSASIEDADAGSANEQALFGEPGSEPADAAWVSNRVVALFASEDELKAALDLLTPSGNAGSFKFVETRSVADADWVRLTQAQFEPICIGKRLWIVPSWHELGPDQARNALQIRLDPGMAFGTGSHATTHLCLAWLVENLAPDQSLIDYGCGSGILAIAAAKLGARPVVGIDIDPQAVSASRSNARDNLCDAEFFLASDYHAQQGDIVLANILSNPLKLLAPLLTALVSPGGRLVLSGVLERQAEEVIEAYRPGIELSVWRARDGWVCLAGSLAGKRA